MIKPNINFISPSDKRKICSFTFDTPMIKNLRAEVSQFKEGSHHFATEIKNPQNKKLGNEVFSLYKDNSEILGLSIDVHPEYRGRHKLGEILRLTSIIEMMENKIERLKIYSKEAAIYFHSKYKFLPNITQFCERDTILRDIMKNKNPEFKNYIPFAKKILSQTEETEDAAEQRELCKKTNTLARDYIQRVLALGKDEYKKYPFSWGIDMVLTRDEILKHKKFFNELFAKHGIDYEI